MAKSKIQKQQEAIERKRQHYNMHLKRYKSAMFGERYKDTLKHWGIQRAEANKEQAQIMFARYCKEARVDEYGTPLKEI